MRKTLCSLGLGLMLSVLFGCQNPGPRFDPYAKPGAAGPEMEGVTLTNQINPAWLRPPTAMFTLGPGDRIEIELLDDPNSRTINTVGPDGKIYFHLLPGLDVWGLTLPETKSLLERELSKFIRDRVQVALTLKAVESKRVWLLGRLQTPGVYPMAGPMTLIEALSQAGGTLNPVSRDGTTAFSSEEVADLRRSFIIRRGQLLPVDFHRLLKEGDFSQNIYLQADDFIYLPSGRAREVYVLGAVGQPRIVPYTEDLTVVGAVASALGTIRDAYQSHVAIVRGSLTEPRIAIVDYKDITHGRAPNVALEPHDIVYVPFAPYRYLTKYADLILNTFVSSVAINEGSRAVFGRQVQPAGVFIPVGSGTVTPATPIAR